MQEIWENFCFSVHSDELFIAQAWLISSKTGSPINRNDYLIIAKWGYSLLAVASKGEEHSVQTAGIYQ